MDFTKDLTEEEMAKWQELLGKKTNGSMVVCPGMEQRVVDLRKVADMIRDFDDKVEALSAENPAFVHAKPDREM